jgi:hypothetical protein
VAQAIYTDIIRREITVATVNRDPQEIALDHLGLQYLAIA